MNVKTAIIAIALAAFLTPAAAMANEYADDYYAYDDYASDYYPANYYAEDEYEADYYTFDGYEADSYDEDAYTDEYYADSDYEADEYAEEAYDEDADWESDELDMLEGVYEFGDRLETWYSSQVAYHYLTPEWWVDDEGFYRTDEGYYVIAASDYELGSVIDGSKGQCIVADSGCEDGVSDYYVAW